jgi:V8-like Glu-specific endopeptidase
LSFLTPGKKMAVGSGVLISRDLVLTAAHNLYDKDVGQENEVFKFYIGASGTAEKYYELEDWRYSSEFKTCPQSEKLEFDYALVKLKQPIDYKEYLELSFPCDTCLINNNKETYLSIFGYPKYGKNYKPLDKRGEKIQLSQFGL